MKFVLILKEIRYILDFEVSDFIIEAINKLSTPYFTIDRVCDSDYLDTIFEKYEIIQITASRISKESLEEKAREMVNKPKSPYRVFNYGYWIKDRENYVILDDYSNSSVIVCGIKNHTIRFEYYSNELLPYDLLRFIRNIYIYSRSRKMNVFHAAALESPPYSFIFTGDKYAGKTTILTYLLKNNNYKFISNDVILVGDDICEGVGKAVSVRQLTFAELELDIQNFNYPYNQKIENGFSKIKMSPNEYCSMVGAELTNEGHCVGACFYITSVPNTLGGVYRITDCKQIESLVKKQTIQINYNFPFGQCKMCENSIVDWYNGVDFYMIELPYNCKSEILKKINLIIEEIVNDA